MNDECNKIVLPAIYKGILGILVFIILILCCLFAYKHNNKQTTSPVEECLIDSINKENTKLIIKVEILDSIKDVEKTKVINLNNDSTLKLFYQLIGE